MLVLSRKPFQRIQIGESVFVTVLEIQGNRVRIGIDAPQDVMVLRTELVDHLTSGQSPATCSAAT